MGNEGERRARTPRQKYGEELRLRRKAANLKQEELGERLICSPTLISHFEAGRRLPRPEDAKRLDQALETNGFFERWLKDLEGSFADYFEEAAELQRVAMEIRQYTALLIPGLLQTYGYARAVFRAYNPNNTEEELDRLVVNRLKRAEILKNPTTPVMWALMDESALQRRVGGPGVMTEQLHYIGDLAESGRVRLHVLPFSAGAHALLESPLSLMSFEEAPPVAYVEGFLTGHLMDETLLVQRSRRAYALALGDALPQRDSVARVRAAAKEHDRDEH